MNNAMIGADGRANDAISSLRLSARNGSLTHDVTFVSGLDLHFAPELEVSGTWSSEEAAALDIDATISGEGGWAALHLALPFESTLPYGMLGIAARTKGFVATEVPMCLRSGTKSGFEDHYFDKPLSFALNETSNLNVIEMNSFTPIPQRAPWRELVLFLPVKSFRLRLIDLRVFLV